MLLMKLGGVHVKELPPLCSTVHSIGPWHKPRKSVVYRGLVYCVGVQVRRIACKQGSFGVLGVELE